MKSKLGVYFVSLGGIDVPGYLRTAQPRIIVSMDHSADTWRAAKQASPNTFIVGRHYLEDKDQIFLDDPEGRAEQFFAAMKSDAEQMRGFYDAWMGYNESVVQSQDEAEKLSRFYVRWGDLMRAAGFTSAAYSFATGNPARGDPRPDGSLEPNYWPFLAEGLRHCDLLSLHEYSAPTLDFWATFLCLRYRKVMDLLPPDARRQIVITETGIDGGAGPANRPQQGWSKFTDAAGYVATLSWYDAELQKDDYVIGATIFAMNGWGIDGSFGIAGVTQIRDYIAQGGAPAPVVVKPPAAAQPVPPAAPVQPAPSTQPIGPQPPGPPQAQPEMAYTIQSGDTLYVVARKFGVTVAAIAAANNIVNPRLIRPGQVLKIPSAPGSPASAPPVLTLPPLILTGPFPRFNLHDPCAQDPDNLIVNGSMGPANHDTPYGTVVDGWDPFVFSGGAPNFRWVDNEMIEPGGSQQIYALSAFDAGVMQTVQNLKPGTSYMLRWGYSLAAKSYDGPNVRVNTIGRKLGVDLTGGRDPHASTVQWGADVFDGRGAVNLPQMQVIFVAVSPQATVFLRAMATDGSGGENRCWMDAICMEARTEMPAILIVPPAAPLAAGGASATSYTVRFGDTLFAIARKFGVTVDAIVTANDIGDPGRIRPGKILKIPAKT